MFRIMLVFLLPCSSISSLSNHSDLSNGWVYLFSVISIGSVTLFFFGSDLHHCFAFELYWIFIHVHKALIGFLLLLWGIGGIIVIGDPVMMMNSIGCPSTNRILL